jgi:hypothetical protein
LGKILLVADEIRLEKSQVFDYISEQGRSAESEGAIYEMPTHRERHLGYRAVIITS